jgi:hypothetical protein
MNDNDRLNLDFLRALSKEGFTVWYLQADADDIKYADELFSEALREVTEDSAVRASGCDEARDVLKRFML